MILVLAWHGFVAVMYKAALNHISKSLFLLLIAFVPKVQPLYTVVFSHSQSCLRTQGSPETRSLRITAVVDLNCLDRLDPPWSSARLTVKIRQFTRILTAQGPQEKVVVSQCPQLITESS